MMFGSRRGALNGFVVVALGAAAVSCDGAPPGETAGGDGGPGGGDVGLSAGAGEGVQSLSGALSDEACDDLVVHVCRTDTDCRAGTICLPSGKSGVNVCLQSCSPFHSSCDSSTKCKF